MKQLIFATGNEHKLQEIREILKGLPYEILSMKEKGIAFSIEENGTTFEENAMIKARAVAKILPESLVVSDDSGLVIDALQGEPGIYSARYGGVDTSYEIKNQMLLERLSPVPKEQRQARFICVVAIVFPDGEERIVRGVMEGEIALCQAGENGFGYDPIFLLPEYGCTAAELSSEEKHAISHRGKALRAMRKILEERA